MPASVSEKELRRRHFLLHGNLWAVVLSITAPLLLFSLFNYAYSIIDTIMCSGIGESELDAVGALTQANNLISSLGAGLSAGGSILVARQIGKKNYARAKGLASAMFFYVFLMAILTCVIVIPLARPILRLLNISEASIQVGQYYFMVLVGSSACVMINTVYMGVEKAKGSTLFISLLNMGVVVVKIALNFLFLYGFNLKDMVFVSLSTLLANACLTLFVLFRIASKNYLFHFSIKKADKTRKTFLKTMKISFPVFLGKFIFSFGKVIVNALCKNYSDNVVGALGVSNNMGGAVTTPILSFEDSESAIISTNLGAGNLKRALHTFWIGLTYALSIAVLGVILVSVFNDQITHFFARNANDVEAYAAKISEVFFYEKMGIITLALNSAVLGLLYGFGATVLSSALNVARAFVFRIPIFLICSHIPGIQEDGFRVAGISMGVSNICIGITAAIAGAIYVFHIIHKQKVEQKAMVISLEQTEKIDALIDAFLDHFGRGKSSAPKEEEARVLNGAMLLFFARKEERFLDFVKAYFEPLLSQEGELLGFLAKDIGSGQLALGSSLAMLGDAAGEERYKKSLQALMKKFPKESQLVGGKLNRGCSPSQIGAELFDLAPLCAYYCCKKNDVKGLRKLKSWFAEAPLSIELALADVDVFHYLKEHDHPLIGRFFKKQLKTILGSLDGEMTPAKDALAKAYCLLKGARLGMLSFKEIPAGSGALAQSSKALEDFFKADDRRAIGTFMMAYSEYLRLPY